MQIWTGVVIDATLRSREKPRENESRPATDFDTDGVLSGADVL